MKADAYINHLDEHNMSKRQKRRHDVCQTIFSLEKQLQKNNKQPRREIQGQFLQQLVAKAYREKNTEITQEQLEVLANKMLNKKVVRTALDKINIHELKQAKDALMISVKENINKIGKGVDQEEGFEFDKAIGLNSPQVNI